ncbi:MAG: hypothetical protein DCO98_05160 [Altererythrobacter sp. XM-24bin4]|nr:MAG: hypothetical protein DCO98_05160 [Altererythrobacter sp. XM-24bin4]
MKIAESQLQIVLDKAPFPTRNFCPSTVFHVFHPVGIEGAILLANRREIANCAPSRRGFVWEARKLAV